MVTKEEINKKLHNYTSESRSNNKSSTKRLYKNDDKRSHQGTAQSERAQKNDNKSSQGRSNNKSSTVMTQIHS